MLEYGRVAEDIKEMIIQDYLKKHPQLTRDDVITKSVNGRVICETINKTIHKISGNYQTQSLTKKEKELLKKLREGHDDRYAATIDSVSICYNYIKWFQVSNFVSFSESTAKEHQQFLERKETEAGKRAIELLVIRRKFSTAIGGHHKPSQSLINTLMLEYTQAIMEQFKVQCLIYGKEIDLSEYFRDTVQNFLQSHFDHFSNLEESVLLAIGKACQMLHGADLSKVLIQGNDKPDTVKAALAKFDERLNQLRDEFEMIQKLITYLEKILEDLGKLDNRGDMTTQESEKSQNSNNTRMVFANKRQR